MGLQCGLLVKTWVKANLNLMLYLFFIRRKKKKKKKNHIHPLKSNLILNDAMKRQKKKKKMFI